jgi:hypothetical protein
MKRPTSTQTSKFIKAPPETVYRAFTDPAALGRVAYSGADERKDRVRLVRRRRLPDVIVLPVVRCGKRRVYETLFLKSNWRAFQFTDRIFEV